MSVYTTIYIYISLSPTVADFEAWRSSPWLTLYSQAHSLSPSPKHFVAGPVLENFGHPLCISKMLSKKSNQTFGAEGIWRAFFMSPAATSGDQLGIISCIARSQLFQGKTLQNYHQVLIHCSSVSLTLMYKKSVYLSTWKMFHQSGSFQNACTR